MAARQHGKLVGALGLRSRTLGQDFVRHFWSFSRSLGRLKFSGDLLSFQRKSSSVFTRF